MKPIALQLYTLRQAAEEDFIAILKQVAEIGFQGVELAGLYGRSPGEIRKVLDDLGLVVCSAPDAVPTPGGVDEVVETAKTLGYDTVIACVVQDRFKTLDDIKAVADELQSGAELLAPHGMRMAYHNHWWEFDELDGRLKYDILLDLAPDVLCEIDVYWASNFGKIDVPAVVASYAARLPLLHVKDGLLVPDPEAPHTAVGAGKVDIPAAIGAADPAVLEWLIVELDRCATDIVQAVRDSYQYLASSGLGGTVRHLR